MPVCIIGMHRSGTSMIARILNASGLYLGRRQDLRPARSGNEEGYWEHLHFLDLNNRILAKLGGNHVVLPRFNQHWTVHADLEELQLEAENLVESFSDFPHWGWKTTTTSLTLPFWKEVVSPLQAVVCVRNPVEVCESMERYFNLPKQYSLRIWLIYYQRILKSLASDERIVTHFESYFQDWEREVRRVTRFLNLPLSSTTREIASTIAPRLRHHNAEPRRLLQLSTSRELERQVITMYNSLCFEADQEILAIPEAFSKCERKGEWDTSWHDYAIDLISKRLISTTSDNSQSRYLLFSMLFFHTWRKVGVARAIRHDSLLKIRRLTNRLWPGRHIS